MRLSLSPLRLFLPLTVTASLSHQPLFKHQGKVSFYSILSHQFVCCHILKRNSTSKPIADSSAPIKWRRNSTSKPVANSSAPIKRRVCLHYAFWASFIGFSPWICTFGVGKCFYILYMHILLKSLDLDHSQCRETLIIIKKDCRQRHLWYKYKVGCFLLSIAICIWYI